MPPRGEHHNITIVPLRQLADAHLTWPVLTRSRPAGFNPIPDNFDASGLEALARYH